MVHGRGSRKKKQKHFSYFDASRRRVCFVVTNALYGDRDVYFDVIERCENPLGGKHNQKPILLTKKRV